MADRFTVPVAVFLLLIRDGKVLLLRRQNTGWYDDSYDVLAGHIEGRERLTTAVCREAKEEIGIHIAETDLEFTTFFHSFFTEDGKEYIYVFFEASHWEGEPKIMEPHKCDSLSWFDIDDLPKNITPGTRDGLKAFKAKLAFAESGF